MDPARASIVVGGILMLIVGIAHMFFYRIFDWRQVFARVRVLDAKVFYTLHVALMLLGLVLAYVSLRHSDELGRGAGLAGTLTARSSGNAEGSRLDGTPREDWSGKPGSNRRPSAWEWTSLTVQRLAGACKGW